MYLIKLFLSENHVGNGNRDDKYCCDKREHRSRGERYRYDFRNAFKRGDVVCKYRLRYEIVRGERLEYDSGEEYKEKCRSPAENHRDFKLCG